MIGGVSDNNVWYVDSGASNHMTSHGEWFRDAKELKTYLEILFRIGLLLLQVHQELCEDGRTFNKLL